MRDRTVNAKVDEAIAAAVRGLKGAEWYLKNPCTLDLQAEAARDQARRWLVAVIPTLPPHLAPPAGAEEIILRRLAGFDTPPPRKKGRYSGGEFKIRDRIIVTQIELITKRYGFKATRNVATRDYKKTESSCSIVRTALGRLGVKMKESAVQEIWLKRAVRAYSPK